MKKKNGRFDSRVPGTTDSKPLNIPIMDPENKTKKQKNRISRPIILSRFPEMKTKRKMKNTSDFLVSTADLLEGQTSNLLTLPEWILKIKLTAYPYRLYPQQIQGLKTTP